MTAQVICIVDVYDALTTTRTYRGAFSQDAALAMMAKLKHYWRPDVSNAFVNTLR